MFFKNSDSGNNQWYIYLAMLLILFIATQLGGLPSILALNSAVKTNPNLGEEDIDRFMSNPDFTSFGIDPNIGFLLLLMPFVLGCVVFYYVFPILHKRNFKSLISWTNQVDWQRIFFGFFLWVCLGSILEFTVFLKSPELFSFQFELKNFIPLLLLSLLILPIQTSLEELLFRSYLMQGIGNMKVGLDRKVMIIFAWIITSTLFGMIHLANPEVQSYGLTTMMFYYIGAGLFLGLITIWDNRLELALGVHAATNFISAVLIGYEGAAIQTQSIFRISEIDVEYATIGFFIIATIFVFICRQKYNWQKFIKTGFEDLKNQI